MWKNIGDGWGTEDCGIWKALVFGFGIPTINGFGKVLTGAIVKWIDVCLRVLLFTEVKYIGPKIAR